MARILIDGRFVGVGESISRYTLEVLSHILKIDKENEYTLLIRPCGADVFADFFKIPDYDPEIMDFKAQKNQEKLKLENLIKKTKSIYKNLELDLINIKHYSLKEQTRLHKYLKEKKYDLVHFTQFNHPVFYKGRFVVTVHDLTMLGHLHRQNPIKRIAFNKVMEAAAKKSVKILTVSETSKKEIIEYYGTKEDKIVVTYLGTDDKYNLQVKNKNSKIEKFRKKYDIPGEYILYTGMWKRHKNLLRMLEAFEKAAKKGEIADRKIQLVMAGKIDKREPEVIELIKKINSKFEEGSKEKGEGALHPTPSTPRIITTGFITEEELPIAYAGASAYIIPSLSEGFGLPPLEAMACGTPVISSKESCMPEILGDVPLYFDPYNVDDMAEAMEKIIVDKELRKAMIPKGLEQVQKYSWEDTAQKTFEVYREVLKTEKGAHE
jgi:glycosyltransferase involved in cell wall biosynthesis